MKTYLFDFFERFSYPEEARVELEKAYDAINSNSDLKFEFDTLLNCYAGDINYPIKELIEPMNRISECAGFHQYTGELLLSICMSDILKQYYFKAGLDEQIWYTSMCDLKWKMDECKRIYNVWGTFALTWFQNFFRLVLFGFGKLQFELVPFGRNYKKGDVILTPETMVIKIHIPNTGSKLDRESLLQSYELASAFFQERYHVDPVVFVCHSWFLFLRNKEILSPKSNIYSFISDFDIIEQYEYPDYSRVVRLIFDKIYDGNVDKLPQDTSLRRAYADWIRRGLKTGTGYGVYIFNNKNLA